MDIQAPFREHSSCIPYDIITKMECLCTCCSWNPFPVENAFRMVIQLKRVSTSPNPFPSIFSNHGYFIKCDIEY